MRMLTGKDTIGLKILQEQIEIVRNRMQQLRNEKGHTDTEVLNASIELDCLMNEYHRRIGWFYYPRR